MQQHPIPQNVTQYQFRLVGDMTLKQFLELAGGLILAYLFYASNLLFFIKWPLALLSLFLGIALAFFPIEERPLDVWIINFIKSIYSPTRFIWEKTNHTPSLFDYTSPANPAQPHSIKKTVKAPTKLPSKPSLPDYSQEELNLINSLNPILTKLEPIAKKISPTATKQATPAKPSVSIRKLSRPKTIYTSTKPNQPASQPKPQITITKNNRISPPKISTKPSPIKPKPIKQKLETTYLPASPKKPNLIVGMVVDKNNKIISNAIVEIVSPDGIPVRAIKTNSIGQFYISTPLPPNQYLIQVEAPNLHFTDQSLYVKNKIIPPIIIRADNALS